MSNFHHQLQHLGFRSYREYLLSNHWKRTRKWLFYSGYVTRDSAGNLVCSACQLPRTPLHVHHKSYQNLGYEPLTDLQVLCKDCHSEVHNRGNGH